MYADAEIERCAEEFLKVREVCWVTAYNRFVNNFAKRDQILSNKISVNVVEPLPVPNPDAYWRHPTFGEYLDIRGNR